MKRCVTGLLVAVLAAPSCPAGAEDIAPYADARHAQRQDTEEARLWEQSRELDQAIRKAGRLNEDAELNAYVRDIAERLFPEFHGSLRLSIVRSPLLNAFAVPNGSLYINEGMIARSDNEAQLATVIAHEGAHFTHRHGYRSQQEVKNAAGVALVVAMLGVPLIGDLIAMSSIFGYSRDLEREADKEGFARLTRAGYDVREAPRVFEHLAADVQASGAKEPFFFSSHPKLQERVESFHELADGHTGGTVNADDFLRRTAALRLDVLREELTMGRYRNVLVMLAPAHRAKFPPEADYYLGEAYRLRGETGDAQRAFAAWSSASARAPQFAPPQRALGVHYLKQANYPEAIRHLEAYLRLAPDANDRKYVEQYLGIAKSRIASP